MWILITGASITLPHIYSDVRAAFLIFFGTIVVLLVLSPLFTGPPRGVRADDWSAAP
jgi:hypothetical protein